MCYQQIAIDRGTAKMLSEFLVLDCPFLFIHQNRKSGMETKAGKRLDCTSLSPFWSGGQLRIPVDIESGARHGVRSNTSEVQNERCEQESEGEPTVTPR